MTPLGDEFGYGSPWQVSAVWVEVANAQGQPTHTLVGWDHQLNAVIEPGAGPTLQAPSTDVVPQLMYDSTNLDDIPASAQIVASYVDGAFVPSSAQLARFQGRMLITISAIGNTMADFCDREPGDLTADQAAWYEANVGGPGLYCSLVDVPAVKAALGSFLPAVKFWIAHYTGVPHAQCDAACVASVPGLPADTLAGVDQVACQYADPNTGSGGHYDLSLVTPEFLATF